MRRLVLEVSRRGLAKIRGKTPFEDVKSLQILHHLQQDKSVLTAIARVELRNPGGKIDVLKDGALGPWDSVDRLQVLEREKDGTYVVFIRGRQSSSRLNILRTAGGYIMTPFEIADGKGRLTFLGTNGQIRELLDSVEREGVHYRIVSIADAKFSPESPLSVLTEKQRRAVTVAYRLGYYDVPRRISSRQLAQKLRIGSSAAAEHLRKAERRLLGKMLDGA